jgi:beta-fructofuranosidase
MNDPNGFSVFNNEYHLFYQFNPNSSFEPGIAHWGHAKSSDLFHWEHLPIAMYPDEAYDSSGVFSGSALIENDTMYLFYTGNVNHPGKSPDHEQHQALAISTDGVNVVKYAKNPILKGEIHQPNIRDPKVWKNGNTYYMVLGNSFANETLGRALLYSSQDKINWEQETVISQSDGSLGYMWECPDFFEIDGRFVLLFSPQGIKPKGDNYRNLYQTGYIVGDFDYKTNVFKPLTQFVELDRGHDYYATQTIVDDKGRRILVAWFDMWEQDYPERKDGWTGLMTIPRELSLTKDNVLIQKPVEEVERIRGKTLHKVDNKYYGAVTLNDKAGEVLVTAKATEDLHVVIESEDLTARLVIGYDAKRGRVTLNRGGKDGIRRAKWRPEGDLNWRIFIDASSVELFCGKGELTFSSRFFPKNDVTVHMTSFSRVQSFMVNSLERSVDLYGNH